MSSVVYDAILGGVNLRQVTQSSYNGNTSIIDGTQSGELDPSELYGGETYGRDVECRAHLFGYNSVALLKAAIGRIRDKQGKLTGTLTVTGNLAQTLSDMTFVEVIEPPPGARYDGSGVNGWHQEIILRWRQRK